MLATSALSQVCLATEAAMTVKICILLMRMHMPFTQHSQHRTRYCSAEGVHCNILADVFCVPL